nr:MAG TPA: hypothetical protein [Caudoviricetes sp.]
MSTSSLVMQQMQLLKRVTLQGQLGQLVKKT